MSESGLQFEFFDDEDDEYNDHSHPFERSNPSWSEDQFERSHPSWSSLFGARTYFDTPLSLRSPRMSIPHWDNQQHNNSTPLLLPASPSSSYSSSPSGSFTHLPLLLALPPSQPFSSSSSSSTTTSHPVLIPEDVYPLILSFLDARTLHSASLASSHLRDLVKNPDLWVGLCLSVWGISVDELMPPEARRLYWLMERRLNDLKSGALLGSLGGADRGGIEGRLRSASF